MNVLMTGVSPGTRGGMWSVVKCYLDSEAFQKKVDCIYLPTATKGSFIAKVLFAVFSLGRIFAVLLLRKPEIVHCHMSERGSVARKYLVLSMARRFGCRTVLHLHGAELEQWYRDSGPLVKGLVRATLNKADRILLLGEYWRPFMRELRVEDRCRILYNAVPCPAENRYDPKAASILFLGEVGDRKGAFDLLEAFCKACPNLPEEVTLSYCGIGETERLCRAIDDCGLQDRVFCKGWLEPEELPRELSQTMLHVLPSYHEGLPMSILETMAYGVPNLSTPVAAIPELIDGTNGRLIRPGDILSLSRSLEELAGDEAERINMSERAYRTIREHFSVQVHIRTLLDLYEELL